MTRKVVPSGMTFRVHVEECGNAGQYARIPMRMLAARRFLDGSQFKQFKMSDNKLESEAMI